MEGDRYLFIDGGYAHQIYRDAMQAVFGVAGELSVAKIVLQINVFRTYYYDCLDDSQKDGESKSAFDLRLQSQEAYFSQIESLPRVHLRLGTVMGRRRRQKEVDVLLAVDMLTHGFNRSMGQAALVAGDLDFRPVVDALIRAGIYVEVWYENTSGSKGLYRAADLGRPINWSNLYMWSSDAFLATHQLPKVVGGAANEYLTASQLGCGSFEGGTVELMSSAERGPFILHVARPGGTNEWLKHDDRNVLLGYFSALHGPLTWKSLREG